MRIAEVVNNLEIGGAERIVVDLSLELKTRGHSVDVVCIRGEGPLAEPLRLAGIAVSSFAKNDNGFSFSALRGMTAFFRSKRIEVVHTHNPLTHHYGVLGGRLGCVPVIVSSLHGPGNLEVSHKTNLIYDSSCLFSDHVVNVCRTVAVKLSEATLVARRKASVIPNGIRLERFLWIPPRPETDALVFGAVGRLVPIKNHQLLLAAFARIAGRYPKARVEILGGGSLESELSRLAADLEIARRVKLCPPALDVAAFLSRIHAFVICSKSEGLPLTLIEAMASGLPVVATAVGEIPEIVRAARCGWLADPENIEDLARCMEAAIVFGTLGRMGARGRQYVAEHHSLESMTTGYERLFAQLLDQSKN
jgi:glycosyltransferase involved in cell wall biosynthesis